jgi:phosphopantothenoylcysteine synthetase/decarboxylase
MKILLAVTGGIAAYKACGLTSVLDTLGHEVQCVMTDKAQEFISAMSLAALSHKPVLTNKDEWSCTDGKIPHIYYTQEWADIFVIVPATANTISKISMGIADEIVSCMALAVPESLPRIIFPAMNTVMLEKNITRSNIKNIELRGWAIGDTQEKKLACGSVGKGGLEKTRTIVEMIERLTNWKENKID